MSQILSSEPSSGGGVGESSNYELEIVLSKFTAVFALCSFLSLTLFLF